MIGNRFLQRFILVVVMCLPALQANTLDLGFISFDVFIPGLPGLPGSNIFSINNFTGDPLLGGFALDPVFPSFTPVTFMNSTLSLVDSGGFTQVVLLGDLDPGTFTPPSLEFSDTVSFAAATFSATLSTTIFQLSNGTTFTAVSPNISVTLLGSSGPFLTPGVDSAIIFVDAVPEPTSWVLLPVLGVLSRLLRRRIRPSGV